MLGWNDVGWGREYPFPLHGGPTGTKSLWHCAQNRLKDKKYNMKCILYILTLISITTLGLHAQNTDSGTESEPSKMEAPAPETFAPNKAESGTGMELNWSENKLPNFLSESSFRAFVPNSLIGPFKKVIRPRAILIIIPGSNGDGRNISNEWKAFAEAEKVMVIGTCFKSAAEKNYETNLEMARVLDEGVKQILKQAEINNKDIPWLITGYSAGGNVLLTKAVDKPNQMLALAVSKSAGFAKLHVGEFQATYDIPTIFYLGGKDPIFKERPINRYWDGRKNKALWTMVLDKEGGHEEPEKAHRLYREYFSAMLEMRLGPVKEYNPSMPPKPSKIKITNGITVSPETFMEDRKLKAEESVWVPNHPKILSALRGS
jgi:predicted esterase